MAGLFSRIAMGIFGPPAPSLDVYGTLEMRRGTTVVGSRHVPVQAHGDYKTAEAIQDILTHSLTLTEARLLDSLAQYPDPAVSDHPEVHTATLHHLRRLNVVWVTDRKCQLRWSPGVWAKLEVEYFMGQAPVG